MPARMAKTVEMPTRVMPEVVIVRPETMTCGAQMVTATSVVHDRRKPPTPASRASPVVRHERRMRLGRMTATGTAKVARPSTVCRGKTRIWRSRIARAFCTSAVTPVVVSRA